MQSHVDIMSYSTSSHDVMPCILHSLDDISIFRLALGLLLLYIHEQSSMRFHIFQCLYIGTVWIGFEVVVAEGDGGAILVHGRCDGQLMCEVWLATRDTT